MGDERHDAALVSYDGLRETWCNCCDREIDEMASGCPHGDACPVALTQGGQLAGDSEPTALVATAVARQRAAFIAAGLTSDEMAAIMEPYQTLLAGMRDNDAEDAQVATLRELIAAARAVAAGVDSAEVADADLLRALDDALDAFDAAGGETQEGR